MNYTYDCYFSFGVEGYASVKTVSYPDDGLSAFSNGFWITYDHKFTKGRDRLYWIPPSKILYVKKVKVIS